MAIESPRRRVAPWVGPWLQSLRQSAGVKREEIAKALGRDLSAVSRLERGDSSIPADDLPIVLRAYGSTPDAYAVKARSVARRSAA